MMDEDEEELSAYTDRDPATGNVSVSDHKDFNAAGLYKEGSDEDESLDDTIFGASKKTPRADADDDNEIAAPEDGEDVDGAPNKVVVGENGLVYAGEPPNWLHFKTGDVVSHVKRICGY